jgi:hypothetical protein
MQNSLARSFFRLYSHVEPQTVNTFVNPASFSSLPALRDEKITQRSREMNAEYAPLVIKIPGQALCDSKDGNVASLIFPCAPDHTHMLIVADFSELILFTNGV